MKNYLVLIFLIINVTPIFAYLGQDELNLVLAIKNNDEEKFNAYLEKIKDINKILDDLNTTFLHIAVAYERPDFYKKIINKGGNTQVRDKNGLVPNEIKASFLKVSIDAYLKDLEKRGEEIKQQKEIEDSKKKDKEIETIILAINEPLFAATQKTSGEKEKAELKEKLIEVLEKIPNNNEELLEYYINDSYRPDDESLLHLAIEYGLLDLIDYLLLHGAEKAAVDNNKLTPLHYLVRAPQAKRKAIIDRFKNDLLLFDKEDRREQTPLSLLIKDGDIASLDHIKSLGAKINTKGDLIFSVNSTTMMEWLISNGAEIDYQDPITKLTPLENFVYKGESDIVRLLKEKGANTNILMDSGHSLLHLAALRGNVEIIQDLLQWGIDKDLQTRAGDTALHLAATMGFPGIVKILLDNGASKKNFNTRFQTPYDAALAELKKVERNTPLDQNKIKKLKEVVNLLKEVQSSELLNALAQSLKNIAVRV